EREVDQSSSDCDRGAGTRTTRYETWPMGVRTDAVRRPHTDEARRELVHVGLADDNGTRGAQYRNHWRIEGRNAAERGARGGGRHTGHVDVVLHGEHQAGQSQA